MITSLVSDTPTAPIVPAELRERTIPSLFDASGEPIDPAQFPQIDHVMAHRSLPEAHLRHLTNAYLYNDVIFLYDDDQGFRPLDSTWRPGADRLSRGPGFLRRATAAFGAGPINRIKRGFFVGSAGSSNYGHWLVDDLPRGILGRRFVEPMPFIYTKFRPEIDVVKEETLRLIRPYQGNNPVGQLDMTLVEDMYFVDPISLHPIMKSRFAIESLRDLTEKTPDQERSKIFINRRSGIRQITNFAELEPLLIQRGFCIINAENYSFAKQVAYFNNADVVVGIMGAAMTNVIFCERTTPILHLAPSGWEEPFYWDLCDTAHLRYAAMYGQVEPGHTESHMSDFRIEPDAFFRVLDAVCAQK